MDETDKLKASFRNFLTYAWAYLGLPAPTPVQLDIAHYLQHGGRRIGVQAFRGVGKSWITSVFAVWLLLRDKDTKILVVSASKERADAFSIFTKKLLEELPAVHHLYPNKTLGDRISNVAFDVRGCTPHQAPSVKSVGITGQITGSRADYIIADDVEVVNNSESALLREKLLGRIAELGGAVLTPDAAHEDGGIVFLGTPQVEDSIYGKLPERGYEFRIWPATVPEEPEKYQGLLAPMVTEAGAPGTPLEPTRFDLAELAERKQEYGAAAYTLQFQLDTTLSDLDRHPLRLADFIVAQTDSDIAPDRFVWGSGEDQELPHLPLVGLTGDRFFGPLKVHEKWSPYEGAMMYIDPSGRGKDQTGFAVVKYLHGLLFIREWGGLPGGYDDRTLTKLAQIAKKEAVRHVRIEDNFGDGMFRELFLPVLRRVYVTKEGEGCAVEGEHVQGQKEVRIIDRIEPALAGHRIVIDLELVKRLLADKTKSTDPEAVLKSPFYQLTRITRDKGALKYDDCIDALSGAINYWTERMAADVNKRVKGRQGERRDNMLRAFSENLNFTETLRFRTKEQRGPEPSGWGGDARPK